MTASGLQGAVSYIAANVIFCHAVSAKLTKTYGYSFQKTINTDRRENVSSTPGATGGAFRGILGGCRYVREIISDTRYPARSRQGVEKVEYGGVENLKS